MKVLIADDEKNIRQSLAATFRLEGHGVVTAADGPEALETISRQMLDLAILDLQMPGYDGLEVLRRLRAGGHGLPVIILTAHGSIEKAVEAVQLGAFDFIEKPPHAEKILLSARNAVRQVDLEEENRELRSEAQGAYDMIGTSPAMQALFEQIRRAAPTQARVLILGENGTGKELIARALHQHSPRAAGPFVRINCAAIPRELFESELFGHERGAFTGATARRRGKLVRADRGTLFLDEVGEIPLELQAKLLRALESGEVEPVGSEREVKVDVRVLAATNRDLERAVNEGAFREDLYYRLQVVTLLAPPLRERREDIPALVAHFVAGILAESHLPHKRLTEGAMQQLAQHDFPGNVRELRNLVERLLILTPGSEIDRATVERDLAPRRRTAATALPVGATLRDTMAELERRVLLDVLEKEGWHMTAAAAALGLERSHLYKKLRGHGIARPADG